MGRSGGMVFGLALLALTAGVANAQTPEGEVAAFRHHRAAAVTALRAEDLDTAARELAEAETFIPNHPGVMMLRARVAAARGDGLEALIHYGRYGGAGLVFDVDAEEALADLRTQPDHAAAVEVIADLIRSNRAPVGAGSLEPLFRIDGTVLAESVVRDPRRDRWLVSLVAGRTIVAVADDGTVTPWLQPDPAVAGMVGLAVDEARGVLWATTAPLPPAIHGLAADDVPATALLQIDLETGRVVRAYQVPADDREHGLGDLILLPDGSVVVSDGQSGDLYRLAGPDQALAPFVTGVFGSPQGLAVVRNTLFVADYSSGLWRMPLDGGTPVPVALPPDDTLVGIDGLATDGTRLFAIQNGVNPQRVLRLVLYPNHEEVGIVVVLASTLPEIDEPTTVTVVDGQLVFVSRSQWNGFDDDGAPRQTDLPPALISRLPPTPEP